MEIKMREQGRILKSNRMRRGASCNSVHYVHPLRLGVFCVGVRDPV
jgi:hypothetical protein